MNKIPITFSHDVKKAIKNAIDDNLSTMQNRYRSKCGASECCLLNYGMRICIRKKLSFVLDESIHIYLDHSCQFLYSKCFTIFFSKHILFDLTPNQNQTKHFYIRPSYIPKLDNTFISIFMIKMKRVTMKTWAGET